MAARPGAGPAPEDSLSRDSLFDGRLHCLQHRSGYRFSLDAVLLARFVAPRPGDKICDLGAGCGVVSLILAFLAPELEITGLELQPALAELARKNIALNNFQQRIRLVQGDLRQIREVIPAGAFDWVVCNPPYGKVGTGRQNAGEEELIARHEIKAGLDEVVRAAGFVVRNRGRVALVYPTGRCAALLTELRTQKLEPKKLQIVYSYPGSMGRLVLVEAVKNGGEELTVLPPFYVYREANGEYSPEMTACYQAF